MYKPFWLSVWQLFFLKISTDVGLMLGNVINLSHTSKWNKSSLRRILKSVDILSDCRRNSMVSHGSLWALPFTKQEPILSFFFPTNEPILSFKTYTRTIPCRKGKKDFCLCELLTLLRSSILFFLSFSCKTFCASFLLFFFLLWNPVTKSLPNQDASNNLAGARIGDGELSE